MPLSKPLNDFRKELQTLLEDDLAGALKTLQEHLPNGTEHFNTVVGLLARLNDANKARLRGTVSNEELQRAYNGIRADFLDMLLLLTETDFETAANPVAANGKPGPKQGNVLYRIPHTMPLMKETRCVVRVAQQEDAIVENITIDEHVELRELKRISELMMVELTDPSSEVNFKIRTTSTPEQIITEEGYSEWFFYVQPLRFGAFPLEIKVSVIELVFGREAKKEYVLSEIVQIVTENEDSKEDETLRQAGVHLTFAGQAAPEQPEPQARDIEMPSPAHIPPPSPPPPHPYIEVQEIVAPYPSETPSQAKSGRPLRTLALFLGFLVLGSATTWAVTPAETLQYWVARVKNSEAAYTEYLAAFPNSEKQEEVLYRRAMLSENVRYYREYIDNYGKTGRYKELIYKKLDEMEAGRYLELSKNLTSKNIVSYLNDFPETKRIYELKNAAERSKVLDQFSLGALENAAVRSIRIQPSEIKIRQFLTAFPENNKLQELNDAVSDFPEVQQKVQQDLDRAYIQQIKTLPSKEQVQTYLLQFPDSVRLEKIQTAIEEIPELRQSVREELRKMERRIRTKVAADTSPTRIR